MRIFPGKLAVVSSIALGLGVFVTPLSAQARPSISSGEKPLEIDVEACLIRADQVIKSLNVSSSGSGPYHRSGYYDDGAFRILCYDTGNGTSLAIFFVAHDESQEVADTFLDTLLDQF
ncbi:MAG: hypothetical protein HC769_33350 [Cyanobacteria bacterium CRU_2_1]|nr:hypothetical protein [Cyanobacteria bacterium RU_5_0]NJR63240.1 hypothetical protein [Cyanobacteria bacterium CRU_2_1]